jgi:hypothetical protein
MAMTKVQAEMIQSSSLFSGWGCCGASLCAYFKYRGSMIVMKLLYQR